MSDASKAGDAPTNEDTAYEPSDVSIPLIVGLLGLVAAMVVISSVILSVLYPGTTHPPGRGPAKPFPAPRLEINEADNLRRFDAAVAHRLDRYGWIDRKGGIVHIPIEEAIGRAAAQGFPDWPGNPPAKPTGAAK